MYRKLKHIHEDTDTKIKLEHEAENESRMCSHFTVLSPSFGTQSFLTDWGRRSIWPSVALVILWKIWDRRMVGRTEEDGEISDSDIKARC